MMFPLKILRKSIGLMNPSSNDRVPEETSKKTTGREATATFDVMYEKLFPCDSLEWACVCVCVLVLVSLCRQEDPPEGGTALVVVVVVAWAYFACPAERASNGCFR